MHKIKAVRVVKLSLRTKKEKEDVHVPYIETASIKQIMEAYAEYKESYMY